MFYLFVPCDDALLLLLPLLSTSFPPSPPSEVEVRNISTLYRCLSSVSASGENGVHVLEYFSLLSRHEAIAQPIIALEKDSFVMSSFLFRALADVHAARLLLTFSAFVIPVTSKVKELYHAEIVREVEGRGRKGLYKPRPEDSLSTSKKKGSA